jgi:capsular polysaccharide transport system permease protein
MFTRRSSIAIVRAVLFALVLREVRGRFGANRLGAFWFVFEPLAHISVLLAVFSFIRGARINYGPDLLVFLIAGIIPFLLFKNIALKGMEAVNANKALFAYRQIKPVDTVLARAISETALMSCVYILIVFALGFWGGHDVLIARPILFMSMFFLGVLLSLGLALIFCVVGEAIPELKNLIKLGYMPLYFLSGVIMPLWVIPPIFRDYLLWNPYVHIIDGIREATFSYYPQVPGIDFQYAACVTIVILFAGVILYRSRHQKLLAI